MLVTPESRKGKDVNTDSHGKTSLLDRLIRIVTGKSKAKKIKSDEISNIGILSKLKYSTQQVEDMKNWLLINRNGSSMYNENSRVRVSTQ